jgi:3,4-dehydroadipyl-CoA semialdehyde dehydrogenase
LTAPPLTAVEPRVLESLLEGTFVSGSGAGATLVNPVTGEVIATASSAGLDLGAALAYARSAGGPALRALTFAQRGERLGAIADVLAAHKPEWYATARANSGNTDADAAIDVDGAIATLKFYARLAKTLGDATMLREGPALRLSRDPLFAGLHVGTSLEGVAIHINAFNFPSWGLWEKAAVALLSGVPVFAKPATATALLPALMVRAVADAGVLPPGALSLLCGPAGDLLAHVANGDAIAFTGSAETGRTVRFHPRVRDTGVRVNVEADSLNATLLGPDATAEGPIATFFVREVVREMTVKAGQKCTAIRRVLVPAGLADTVARSVAHALAATVVGDPAGDGVTMGPLVSSDQAAAVHAGIAHLGDETIVVYHGDAPTGGAFVGPTLLQATGPAANVHEVEIFGPVATIVPYRDADDAFALAARAGGSLVASVFSADPAFLAEAALRLAPWHGRVLLVDPSIGDAQTGHGLVLPALMHGGPGRAGGGEELGGVRGLRFYHQWTAIQGPQPVLDALAARSTDIRGE